MADLGRINDAAARGGRVVQPKPVSLLRYASAVAALIMGAALCYAGAAQCHAGLLQVRATGILEAIDWDEGAIPLANVARAVEELREADRWWPQPVNAYSRGISEIRVAAQDATSKANRALMDSGIRDLRQSLIEDPANAAAWAWLAYGLIIEQGGSPATIDALSMSIALARFDPTLLAMRCEIGLTIYQSLDARRKDLLNDQIRLLGRRSIGRLVVVARVTHSLDVVIRALLAGDNQTAIRFMDMLRS